MTGSNNSSNSPKFDSSYNHRWGGGKIDLGGENKVQYIKDEGWKTPLTHIWSKCLEGLRLTTTRQITIGGQTKNCRIWNSDIEKLKTLDGSISKVNVVATLTLGGNGEGNSSVISPLIQNQGGILPSSDSGLDSCGSSGVSQGVVGEAESSIETAEETAQKYKLITAEGNLESELPQITLDITQTVNFGEHRGPNEGGITRYRDTFKMDKPGLLVSTGTERSLYGLIQSVLASPANYCQGLVIRDINPKVKAYMDFNVFLLRLATDVSDYQELSSSCFMDSEAFQTIQGLSSERQKKYQDQHFKIFMDIRLGLLKSKLEKDTTMNETLKKYYLENLEVLAKSYYEINPVWKNPKTISYLGEFPRYHEDANLFAILQKYAKTGNIITTVGDIGDLEFLSTRNISSIDISNIQDYAIIDFRNNYSEFNPNIISTKVDYHHTLYSLEKYETISKEEKEELKGLLELIISWSKNKTSTREYLPKNIHRTFQYDRKTCLAYYSKKSLINLKTIMLEKVRDKSTAPLLFLDKISETLSPKQIEQWNKELKKHGENKEFILPDGIS